jgi:recombination protein RecR
MYSQSIEDLIKAFSKLPTVGKRTAERYVFYLLRSGKKDVGELTLALKNLIDNVKSCEKCWDFTDQSPCHICSDIKRDNKTICVVTQPQDIQVIEKTGDYHGLYHVLRGTIRPDNLDSVNFLKIRELENRVKNNIDEIILALNPDLNGETTMMYLEKNLKQVNPNLKITRLARGLPMGSDLQYSDEITLGSALKNRREN